MTNMFTLARVGAAGLLVLAVGRHPASYFTLLRWVVCAVAAYGAVQAQRRSQSGWLWTFGGVAVLFNPFAPVYLDRQTWRLLDLASAALMALSVSADGSSDAPRG